MCRGLIFAQSAEDFSFRHLTTENGLSQNSVYKIYQDKHGFMFFGTQVGVDRYDGSDFKKISISLSENITDDGISLLYEDSEHQLVIGTKGKTFRIRCDSIHNKPYYDTLKNVLFITQVNEGNIYFSNKGFYLNSQDFEKYTDFGTLTAIVEDSSHIYFGTLKGIYTCQISDIKPGFMPLEILDTTITSISSLCIDKKEKEYLFVGTDNGTVHKIKLGAQQDPILLPKVGSKINAILSDKYNRLWIGTEENGLYIKSDTSDNFINVDRSSGESNGLSHHDILSIYESDDGTIWIGTNGGGVNIYHPEKLFIQHIYTKTYPEYNVIDNHVWAIRKDMSGKLWLGTQDNGIVIYNEQTDEVEKKILPKDTSNKAARLIACFGEKGDTVLIGTDDGLYWINSSGNSSHYERVDIDISDIRSIEYDASQNRIFIGTTGRKSAGLYVLNEEFKPEKELLEGVRVSDIYIHRNSSIWLATEEGLKKYDDSGKYDELCQKVDNCNHNVNSILGVEDTLWLGTTYKGLIKYNIKKGETDIIDLSRFKKDFIYGILSDNCGGLWVSTNDGLVEYHPTSDLINQYRTRDGLQSDEFNSGAFYRDGKEYTLYFGGIKGINKILPKDSLETFNAPVAIEYSQFHKEKEKIVYGQTNLEFPELERLQNDFRSVHIKPLILHYKHPENNSVRYKINAREWKNLKYGEELTITESELKAFWFFIPRKNTINFEFRTSESLWSKSHNLHIYVKWFSVSKLIILFAGLLLFIAGFLLRRDRWHRNFRKIHERVNNISRQDTIDEIGEIAVSDFIKYMKADYVIISFIDFNRRMLDIRYAGIYNERISVSKNEYTIAWNEQNNDKVVEHIRKMKNVSFPECDLNISAYNKSIHHKFLKEKLLKEKQYIESINRLFFPIIHRAKLEPTTKEFSNRKNKDLSSSQTNKNSSIYKNDFPIGIVELGKFNSRFQRYIHSIYKRLVTVKSAQEVYIDNLAQPYYDALLKEQLKLYEAAIKNNINESKPETFLKAFLKEICELCKADYGNIALKTFNCANIDVLEKEIFYGFKKEDIDKDALREITDYNRGITNHVYNKGKAYMNGDVSQDKENVVILKDVKSEIAVPIVNENRKVGVLTLCTKKADFFNPIHYTLSEIVNQAIDIYLKKKQRYSLSKLANQFNVFSGSEEPILSQIVNILSEHFNSRYVSVWQRNLNKTYDFKLHQKSTSPDFYQYYVEHKFLEVTMERGQLEKGEEKIEVLNNEKEKNRREAEGKNRENRISTFCNKHEFIEYLVIKIPIEKDYEFLVNIFSKNKINLTENDYSFLQQVVDKTADAIQGHHLVKTFGDFSNSLFKDKAPNTLMKIAEGAVEVLHVDNVVLYSCENQQISKKGAIRAGHFVAEKIEDKKFIFVKHILENGSKWLGNNEEYNQEIKKIGRNLSPEHKKNSFRIRERIEAVAALRLEYEETPLGIMFFNYRTKKDFNTPDTKKFIEGFADLATITLRNDNYVEELKNETKKIEENNSHLTAISEKLLIEKEELEQKYDKAYKKMTDMLPWATKTSFYMILDGINHDIRNFLIKMKIATLKIQEHSDSLPKADRHLIDEKIKEVGYTTKLITNVLDLFDFKYIKKEVFGINDLIIDLIFFFKNQDDEISFDKKKLADNLPDIYCFKVELSMILYNLINNAVQGISELERKRRGKIELATKIIDKNYLIEIKDNGIGIDNNELDRIFEPGYTTKKDGVGIGLYFVQEVLRDSFYGTIEADSTVREGVKFSIIIPEFINHIDND